MAEPAVDPMHVDGCEFAYRGVSPVEREQILRLGSVSPESELPNSVEAVTLLTAAIPRDHILERKRRHMRSFSLQRGTALWYATRGGTTDGWLATIRLPVSLQGLCDGGMSMASFAGSDGTEWIDPRHLYVDAGFLEWEVMRARALADQEILLVIGAAKVLGVEPVRRTDASAEFTPWQYNGERKFPVKSFGFGPPIF